jgi:hypothetical protein
MVVVLFSLTFTQCANPWVIVAFSLIAYVNFLISYFILKCLLLIFETCFKNAIEVVT